MHICSALLKFISHVSHQHESLNISMLSYVYFISTYFKRHILFHLNMSMYEFMYLSTPTLQLQLVSSFPQHKKGQIGSSNI